MFRHDRMNTLAEFRRLTAKMDGFNPDAKTAKVHRSDGTGVILNDKDHLSGEDVLPGFTCLIGDLFLLPQAAASKP